MTDQLDPVSQPTSEPEPAVETVPADSAQDTAVEMSASESSVKCPSCGMELKGSFMFCPGCGKGVSSESSAGPSSDPSTPDMSAIVSKIGGEKNLKKIAIGGGIALVVVIIALLFATHVICFHEWKDATCLNAKRCTICKQTEGKALGHDYAEATCTEPKTCERCGEVSGTALGHSVSEWVEDSEATCAAEGQKHGTCDMCGEEISEVISKLSSHTVESWTTTKEATCSAAGSKSGTCSVCGDERTESIAKKDHTAGSWQLTGTPYISNGNILYTKETQKCTVCGEQIDSKSNETELSIEQRNALNRAWDYLDYTAFSYSGLVDQLEFEGYSTSTAKFAADNCGADWYQQAAKKAQAYLDYTSFSRSGLISQLKYEGFTQDQAEYGVKAVGY